VAVGPMYSTAVKPEYATAGPDTLVAVRQHTSLPLVAIGGITSDNIGAVLAAGARCVCVCSAVIAQDDPAAAAVGIRRCLP
jgi:thiamine-phosphate pyrophosphorylase